MGVDPVTPFVGRRHELTEVKRLLSTTRLLTLIGVGGIGKTRLALRLAAQVTRAFRHGVRVVDLSAVTDPELVPGHVATELDLRCEQPDVLAALISHLEPKQLILVLDNCEHVLDAAALLVGKLQGNCSDLRILATSRVPLDVTGEVLYQVPPLVANDAVDLFTDRARRKVSDWCADDATSVAELCRKLEGTPLAIELTAPLVQVLPVREIHKRLDGMLLQLTGPRDAPPRQRTLRALFDWSFDLCSPQERSLWERLSVFSGEFDLEAAEEVCAGGDLARDVVFNLLVGLVQKSIVSRQKYNEEYGSRFRLLETVRRYGRERLAVSGQETVLRIRHLNYYQRIVEQAKTDWFGPHQLKWISRLRREMGNTDEMLEFCCATPGQAGAGLNLLSDLAIFYWLYINGSFSSLWRWLTRLLTYPASDHIRGKGYLAKAWISVRQGDPEAARAMLLEADKLTPPHDMFTSTAIRHFSALADIGEGNYGRAIDQLEVARHGYNDRHWQWMVIFHLAMAYAATGQDDLAQICADQCLEWARTDSATMSRSSALWVAGIVQWSPNSVSVVEGLMHEALATMREYDDTWGIAECLTVLAWVLFESGRARDAARLRGAAQNAWQMIQAVPWPVLISEDNRHTQELRRLLGEDYDREFARGKSMAPDKAVAMVLGKSCELPQSADQPIPLTRRESEVAGLVAQGLSNKQIAAKLIVAPRTAERHVENIMVKLGYTNRAQIAAWIARSDSNGRSDSA